MVFLKSRKVKISVQRALETRDCEQAFGHNAEDGYENDDEDEKKYDDNLVLLLVLVLVLENAR